MLSEPSAGWFEGREHRLAVRIYYEDTDFTGLVYHANYLRYLERGRSDFLRLAGVSHTDLLTREDPTAFVITRLGLDFRAPARIDDALVVATTYDRVKGPRLHITQKILRADALIAEAAIQAAFIGLDGRPRRPPAGMLAMLSPWFAPPAP
jgi:acyl-CoA thioester hydrolase